MKRVAVLAIVVLAGCSSEGTLVVQVRTDIVPDLELDAIRTSVGGMADLTVSASAERDWGRGVRVAEVRLPEGEHSALVSALDAAGDVIVERPVRVDVRGGEVLVVTVLLTRDCSGVMCPGAADDPSANACLAGRCVEETCTEETPEGCGPPTCSVGETCDPGPVAACAEATCTASGACFVAPRHDLCAADEVCDPTDGCRTTTGPACVRDPWMDRAYAVNLEAGPGGDGSSAAPFDTIEAALSAARTEPREIWVAATTDLLAAPTITVSAQAVVLRGGFEPCNFGPMIGGSTRIGVDANRAIDVLGGADLTLDHFDVTNTRSAGSGLVAVVASSTFTLTNSALTTASGTTANPVAILAADSEVVIETSVLNAMDAPIGVGIDMDGGTLSLDGVTIIVMAAQAVGMKLLSTASPLVARVDRSTIATMSTGMGVSASAIELIGDAALTLGNTVIDVGGIAGVGDLGGVYVGPMSRLLGYANHIAFTRAGGGVATVGVTLENGESLGSWLVGSSVVSPGGPALTVMNPFGPLALLNNALSGTPILYDTTVGAMDITQVNLGMFTGAGLVTLNVALECGLESPSYMLDPTSACADRGVDPNGLLMLDPPASTDRFGNVRGPMWDIGPSEGSPL